MSLTCVNVTARLYFLLVVSIWLSAATTKLRFQEVQQGTSLNNPLLLQEET